MEAQGWTSGSKEAQMPNILNFEPAQFVGFIVIFARVLGLFLSAPVLSDSSIPTQVKVAFTFITALVFYPVLAPLRVPVDPSLLEVVVLSFGELMVGLLMGFIGRLIFAAISMAGEVAGFQMGVGMAQMFDPSTSQQTTLIGQIKVVFAMLLFVAMNGHHMFIQALAASYGKIGPGGFMVTEKLSNSLVALTGAVFVLALRVGAPLIVSMLAANMSLGLIARTVPQMNVFMVGLPFTIALGLLLLALGFPFFVEAVATLHNQLQTILMSTLGNG